MKCGYFPLVYTPYVHLSLMVSIAIGQPKLKLKLKFKLKAKVSEHCDDSLVTAVHS